MRRVMRRLVVQFGLFIGALLLVLYLNRPGTSNKLFAWTTIRYKTISHQLPDSRGICPGISEASKPALVVARVESDGDPKWLDPLANMYHLCVYTADAPYDKNSKYLQVPRNRGHESMAYLTFIIDNYANIPAFGAVFVHGSRWAWHNDAPDYDNRALLFALDVPGALEPWGYHNLRCDWSASTCSPSSAPPQGSLETHMRAMVEPWNARVASDIALPRALALLFGNNDRSSGRKEVLMGRNDAIRSQCCAQFVVSRERIWQHSRDEYIALRQWLLDDTAPRDDRIAGRILSYMWHILFTLESESEGVNLERLNKFACPRASECYCRLYGRCNLRNCKPGQCFGQYNLPPEFRLPDNWAATHE